MLENIYTKSLIFIFRYVWQQWCTLEATRIYWTILVASITVCNCFLQIVMKFSKMSLGYQLLLLYQQLLCFYQISQLFVAIVAGKLMGIGIILLVICNALIISGWNILPAGFYFLTVGLGLVVGFCICQTLPIVIKCNELCVSMLGKWKRNIRRMPCFKLYWYKLVRAQRPVSINYGLTKFEKETKRNYYSVILEYTMDVLLLM